MATKETKELLGFGFALVGVGVALSDGFQIGDLGKIVDAARQAPAGIAGAADALAEYAGMSDEEAVDLEAWVVANFDIPNDALEATIEGVLDVLIRIHGLAKLIVKPKA
jgi:hypothetical protein